MLTTESIEERVWETLKLKKSLFAGVFDSPTGEVSFAKLGRKTIFQAVKEIFADQPLRPKPIVEVPPPSAVAPTQASVNVPQPAPAQTATAVPASIGGSPAPGSESEHSGLEAATASLLEAGLRFIEAIAWNRGAGNFKGAPANGNNQPLAGLFTRDARTNRPVLSIPLPESLTQDRLSGALSALLNAFVGAAKAGSDSRN